jgi:hypothetical protein
MKHYIYFAGRLSKAAVEARRVGGEKLEGVNVSERETL